MAETYGTLLDEDDWEERRYAARRAAFVSMKLDAQGV